MMSDINAALRTEYREQLLSDERELDARIESAVARDPEIGALQAQTRLLFVNSARDMLAPGADPMKIAEHTKKGVEKLQKQIGEHLVALGLPKDEFSMRYRCKTCGDTGFVGEFGRETCECYKKRRTQMMRKDANLTGAKSQTFETFDASVFPEGKQRSDAENAKKLCEKYANGVVKDGKLNLLMTGASGLGKTFLLNCVADRAIKLGVPVMAMTAFNMLSAMREYHFGQVGEESTLMQLIDCELLLIDDLGTEPMLRNITVEYLFMILNERIAAGLHTVVATNLSPAGLMERYNERVISRLMDRQNGEFIRLEGHDLRFRG